MRGGGGGRGGEGGKEGGREGGGEEGREGGRGGESREDNFLPCDRINVLSHMGIDLFLSV